MPVSTRSRLFTLVTAAAAGAIALSACQPSDGTPPLAGPSPAVSASATTTTTPDGDHGTHGGKPPADGTAPAGTTFVPIDNSKIPTGSKGIANARTGRTSPPSTGDIGAFRTRCAFSHMNYDDPILFPGKKNASHLHTFFGNTATTSSSTAESLASSGNSTCRGGTLDRTGYWAPALVDTRTKTPLTPLYMDGYYKNGYAGVTAGQVRAIPNGLRMIAGNAGAKSGQAREAGQWLCGGGAYKYWNRIPDDCSAGDELSMDVSFPQCWDGKNLDSANHKTHVAYPIEGQGCPSSHPVAMPQVGIIVYYKVPAGATGADLKLASDSYETGPGGYSFHADWFDGWDPQTKKDWTATCNQAGNDCESAIVRPDTVLLGEL